jgi:hypothetical protein
MKKNLISTIILVILFAKIAYCQDSSRVVAIMKTMPTTLFDFDNTVTIGLEIPFNKHWSIQQDLGWGNAPLNVWSSERDTYPTKTNWRFRTQARYYFNEFKHERGRLYVGVEYFHKAVFINQIKRIGRQCSSQSGNCAYFEEANVATHRAISAVHLKFGYQVVVYKNLVIDAFTGIGVREVVVTNDVSAEDNLNMGFGSNFAFSSFRRLSPMSATYPSISLGFSIGYQFKKKIRL